jgi:hypothetical protein
MKGKFEKANYVFVTRLLPNPPLCGSTLLKVLNTHVWVTDFLLRAEQKGGYNKVGSEVGWGGGAGWRPLQLFNK